MNFLKPMKSPDVKIPKVSTYGQTITGSPDVSGPLRRARQTLAGEPTAIRPRAPRIVASPKMKLGKIKGI